MIVESSPNNSEIHQQRGQKSNWNVQRDISGLPPRSLPIKSLQQPRQDSLLSTDIKASPVRSINFQESMSRSVSSSNSQDSSKSSTSGLSLHIQKQLAEDIEKLGAI